jgi:iron-sulfur cluster insertion protein
MSSPITLTPAAMDHFSKVATDKIIKLSIEGGGCSGFQYAWKVIDDPKTLYPNDIVINHDNFDFAIDGNSLMFLAGSTVDYQTGITGSHIDIINPLASASCGCGESVAFK